MVWAHDLDWDFDSPTQRYVFLEMTYWSDRKGVVRMSQAEMGERLSLSRQTVSREFGRLQEIGLVAQLGHGRYGIRFQDSNHQESKPPPLLPKATDACRVCGDGFPKNPIGGLEGDFIIYYTREGKPVFVHPDCRPQERE